VMALCIHASWTHQKPWIDGLIYKLYPLF